MMRHPVSRDLLVPIGDVTVSFALLEAVMQSVVASFLQEHQRVGQIITSELSFRELRAMLVSLYIDRHGKDADYDVLRGLLLRARALEQRRNRIVHSVWAAGDSADSVHSLKSTAKEKAGLHFDAKRFTEAELQSIADDIKTLAGELQAMWMRLIECGKAINNPITHRW